MQYSYEFKARAVQKALNRGPDYSATIRMTLLRQSG